MDAPEDLATAVQNPAPEAELELQSATKKVIFIVDDDEDIREMLRFFVSREGFKTDIFEDGVQLLAETSKFDDTPPDLIVLDIMMPKRNGYEVLKDLQERGYSKIPVLVITGRVIDKDMSTELRREPNVVDFMTKPISSDQLVGRLHKILGTTKFKTVRWKG